MNAQNVVVLAIDKFLHRCTQSLQVLKNSTIAAIVDTFHSLLRTCIPWDNATDDSIDLCINILQGLARLTGPSSNEDYMHSLVVDSGILKTLVGVGDQDEKYCIVLRLIGNLCAGLIENLCLQIYLFVSHILCTVLSHVR